MKHIWQGFKKRAAGEDAFSIAELMVGILLLFVLTFAAFNFSQTGVSLSRASMYNAEVNQEWRQAMDKMSWQLRVAYYFDPDGCVPGGDSISVYSFTNATDSLNIQFRLNDGKLEASQGGKSGEGITNDWAVIASGVENLSFTYYDNYGEEITDMHAVAEDGTAAYTTIKRVEINLGVAREYDAAAGTASEGHRQEMVTRKVASTGTEAVTIRNDLQAAHL